MTTQATTNIDKAGLKNSTPTVQMLAKTSQACVSDGFAQLLTKEGVDVATLPAMDCALLQSFEPENALVFEGMGVSSFGDRYQQAEHRRGRRDIPEGIFRRCFIIVIRTGRFPAFCSRFFGEGGGEGDAEV
jgi:hypothetical protein